MKKSIITLAVMAITCVCFAQNTKKDTVKYEYFYKVPPQLWYQFLNTIHSYKDGLIYNPLMQADEKINTQAILDKALFDLSKFKADSAIVKKIN